MKDLLTAVTIFLSFLSFGSVHAGPDSANASDRTMQVVVSVPADLEKYQDLINEQAFDEAASLTFTETKRVVPFSTDVIRASADAAAGVFLCQDGPTILYLKVINRTAYVLLNIDRDGYAGVSYALARSHPVVEKTLLQFEGIDHVIWNEAPGDTCGTW